ncbi:competence protein ComEA [Scopulibacillus daqui]|uniref:Competence protein ComEA n=1 Tax=Scopulibacillus daqui TaxID=1469162 RepID=A0ABS2Q0L1_9BACL|nr:helix-hairpin-helix domain-containing protein [Scopulibacillus daqui]MBM7645822.1 competence protein ComEA [Scopulibacillus daqui]
MFRKDKIPYVAAAVLLVILVYVSFFKSKTPEPVLPNKEKNEVFVQKDNKIEAGDHLKKDENKAEQREVVVDVKGAVKKPGVYHMENDARIMEVISKAGGLNSDADQKQINMAQKLTDEMVVYIPHKGENIEQANGAAGSQGLSVNSSKDDKVNINTATDEELQKLPGIGPAKSAAIMTYREKSGPFKTVDDLTNVPGIGEKSLEQIKPQATVD